MNDLELALQGAVRQLTDTRDGQVFLRWIMAECGVFRQSFPRDEKLAAWEAGRRAFGLQILERCMETDNAGLLLAKESRDA